MISYSAKLVKWHHVEVFRFAAAHFLDKYAIIFIPRHNEEGALAKILAGVLKSGDNEYKPNEIVYNGQYSIDDLEGERNA